MMMFVRFVLGETSKEKELRRGQNNSYTLQKNIRQDWYIKVSCVGTLRTKLLHYKQMQRV